MDIKKRTLQRTQSRVDLHTAIVDEERVGDNDNDNDELIVCQYKYVTIRMRTKRKTRTKLNYHPQACMDAQEELIGSGSPGQLGPSPVKGVVADGPTTLEPKKTMQ